MTTKYDDRDAIVHGKISTKPLREKPALPSWALKLGMAISGLIFGLFVLVHMIGNLKLWLPDHNGVPAIDAYGEFLRTVGEPLFPREGILWIFRLVLLGCLVVHIGGAALLHSRSAKSRGKFKRTNLMGGQQSFTTRTMVVSGVILLLFIIFHIFDLTIGLQPAASAAFEHGAVQANVIASLSRWPVAIWYILAMLVLYGHLSHGLWTALSDLGWMNMRVKWLMVLIASVLPMLVVVGNILLPLSVLFGFVS